MDSLFNEYWLQLSQLFSNSQQRLYWGYLLSALLISALWLVFIEKGKSTKLNLKSLLISHWLSKSSSADYQVILINKALFLIITPLLITKLYIATLIYEQLHLYIPIRSDLADITPEWLVVTLFTLTLFIFDDFARFFLHKLMHEIPWLWHFHKTHHSADKLTPLTVLRSHPVEGLLFSLRSALVQGSCIAIFIYFFDDKVDLYTVLSVNVLLFIFNILGSNLRHTHIYIRYWHWLEALLISPAQHQIHHSTLPAHFNKNYGATIAVWDKLFHSHCYSQLSDNLQFGLNSKQDSQEHSLYNLYIRAFVDIGKSIRSFLKSPKALKKRSLPD